MVMIGPVLERIQYELLDPIIDRTFSVMSRAGVLPKPPPEIAGQNIDIEYVSMLLTAQLASATSGIERTLQLVGGLVGVDPGVMDNIDVDFAVQKYSNLMNNDPRLIRSPEALKQMRDQRAKEAAQQQAAAQAEQAQKLAGGAKTLS
jgi:hypothetical protein